MDALCEIIAWSVLKMQTVDLSLKIMTLLDEVHSQIAINALDICRVLVREKDFNAIASLAQSGLPQETSQFEPELR